jgi:polysaccharide pyruvyl transferase WcaK-like protein
MRILVEPSDYVLRNVGDMAMLRTAVSRLATYWPNATIQVLSDEPDALQAFCPEATPLAATGRRRWLTNEFIPGRHRAPYLSRPLQALLRNRAPELVEVLWRRRLRQQPSELQALNEFAETVSTADLIIVTGMGGITDAFFAYATDVLETLRLAVRRRKYVAMVGQGFGPLKNPRLIAKARSVLPRVNFIGLREERASRPLLQSLGVAPGRMMTTGDDAIEIAYHLRRDRLGDDIGVNLRASDYSGVGHALFAPLRQVLQIEAKTRQASLVPIRISFVPGEADAETIRHLIDGDNNQSLAGAPPASPEAVIHEIQRCRLLITGSYHAGVFALASGIPTIGLARSPYYIDKFLGLSALFGDGCQTVLLGDQNFAKNLVAVIARLWEAADQVRGSLLGEAARQIKLGHEAYRRIRAEIAARN